MNKAQLGLIALALAAAGCGAEDARDESVMTEQLGLGEFACGWVPANHTFSNPPPNSVGPTSATYGTPDCPNQYVVNAPATPVIQQYRAVYRGNIPLPAQMPCHGIWVAATLYAHYPGEPFFRPDTQTFMAHGWEWEGKCVAPWLDVVPPFFGPDVNYKLAVAAGAVFTTQPVQLQRLPWP